MKSSILLNALLGLTFSLAFSTQALADFPRGEACQQFENVVHGEINDTKSGWQTDQIAVMKDDQLVYEWYDGAYKAESLHSLWSASKSITATLIGAAIQRGDLTLETPLKMFFPRTWPDPIQQTRYDSIRVIDLINMSSGFKWDESYESDPVQSSFIPMLYGPYHKKMYEYALSQPLIYDPGLDWNYNGGNSNILMAILAKIYGGSDFQRTLLFSKLGLSRSFFETDGSGNLVGSSYAYMNPREMLRVGQLYLHDGTWNGERILPEGWVANAKRLSAPLTRPDTVTDPASVKAEGVFSDRAFWLNQDAPIVHMPHEFVHSPADMFFAAGHYGQLLIMLPSQKMIIAVTAHNDEYWSKIDKLVSSAVACLAPALEAQRSFTPGGPGQPNHTPLSQQIHLASQVISHGYLQAILSKELCSCVYVSGLSLQDCVARANLPMSSSELNLLTRTGLLPDHPGVMTKATAVGWALGLFKSPAKKALYNGPTLGCGLVDD